MTEPTDPYKTEATILVVHPDDVTILKDSNGNILGYRITLPKKDRAEE